MNSKQKKIVLIGAGAAVLLLLLGIGLVIASKRSGAASDSTALRQNTLTLVRNYVEREEFDRALSLLEGLLIRNPDDSDASALLDAVLEARRLKNAYADGSGSVSTEELQAALDAAREAIARVSAAADAAAAAASRAASVSSADAAERNKASGSKSVESDEERAGTKVSELQAKKNVQEDPGLKAADDKRRAEEAAQKEKEDREARDREAALQKEQAAAEEAKRKAAEEELSKKNAETRKRIEAVNSAVEKGKERASAGSLRSALSAFDEARNSLPEGEKAYASGKYTEMAESLLALAKNESDSTLKSEALSSALEYANLAVSSDPANPRARFTRGQIYVEQKKSAEALADLLEAARLEPGNYLYHYELGKQQYLRKQFKDARQSFAKTTQLKSDFEAAFFNLGLTNKALGLNSESIAAFRSAIKIKPDYSRAQIEIGRLLDKNGDFKGAETAYKEALVHEPGNVSALRELAALYSKEGRFADAERFFKEALVLGSSDPMTNYNMAVVQLGLQKPAQALDYARKAVEAEPQNGTYLYTYGLAGELNGMSDVAIQQYAKAIAADPKYVKPRINLGIMYLDAGRLDEALNQFNAAYLVEKDNFEVNNNLGKAWALKGSFDKSVEHYARALNKAPRDPTVRANLAVAYVSAGLTEKARDTYKELIALDPSRWEAYHELGKLYISLGDKAGAKAILQELIQKKPDYKNAAEVRALLSTL
ncbi:MAG: tetratricopeptide repeat protein [Spirochaetales bacterium]|nr:tetratricopeptide repeat protein [Spirochaetales bacterium]